MHKNMHKNSINACDDKTYKKQKQPSHARDKNNSLSSISVHYPLLFSFLQMPSKSVRG